MSVLILRPNGTGSLGQQQRSAGSANYECVDEVTLDTSDKTSINTATGASSIGTDLYYFQNHTDESDTINKITLKAYLKSREKGTSTTFVNFVVKIGSTIYEGSTQRIDEHTTYKLFSQDFAVKPSDSSAWSWTDIDNIEAGDKLTANYIDKNNESDIDKFQYWLEVTHGETAGNVKMVKVGGVWKTITNTMIKVNGVWKNVTSNKIFINDTWK